MLDKDPEPASATLSPMTTFAPRHLSASARLGQLFASPISTRERLGGRPRFLGGSLRLSGILRRRIRNKMADPRNAIGAVTVARLPYAECSANLGSPLRGRMRLSADDASEQAALIYEDQLHSQPARTGGLPR